MPQSRCALRAFVQHCAPKFKKRWNRFARPVSGSWRVDATYVKIRRQQSQAGSFCRSVPEKPGLEHMVVTENDVSRYLP